MVRAMKLTDEKVNSIIAEYIGILNVSFRSDKMYNHDNDSCGIEMSKYTESLDALVPVWEKLDKHNRKIALDGFLDGQRLHRIKFWENDYEMSSLYDYEINEYSLQRAAAYATAKAILQLQGGE